MLNQGPALTLITANDAGSEYGLSLQILVMMTVLAIIPSIVILMTSFTRIIIVLSLLRQAMGTLDSTESSADRNSGLSKFFHYEACIR